MAPRSMLLKNGIVLVHDANNHVVPKELDILIRHGKIEKLEKAINASNDVEVIDCTDKIISPGFVDTHHHGWQTQLKGRHANELLLEYLITGYSQHMQFTAKDVFYGQLAGMLEALAAGTTTVVDHAHINVTANHTKQGIAATASSGIRSVFCYTPINIVKSFNPLTFHDNPLEDWVMQTFSELADLSPFGDGRVTLGFAWDMWSLGPEAVKSVFEKVKEKGINLITVHSTNFFSAQQIAKDFGVLDSRFLVSHGGNLSKDDVALLKEHGVHVSATPSTELQMAMGRPVCFDTSFLDPELSAKRNGVQDIASLGVDCHSNNAGSIILEARLGLQDARNHLHEFHMQQGKITQKLPPSLSVEAAFNLATVKGAEAAKMPHEIGRIAEGYRADFAIFDALSPSMVGAAQHDPVAAIIMHSSPADIETVVVDGVVRKREGKLVDVDVDDGAREIVGKTGLAWGEIAREVVKSREVIQKEAEKVDVDMDVKASMKMWNIDESLLVK
ncbi:Metallo-dependent hydrolase [Byssothecium circinans]|uniref:Metallo-dependent hydrolase n=1 Tax=Byssothecium circinans TaxID=147558 RepID=A0A6A5TV81_9PLEO|nr:Metallo-dependent hydrolase [Byssothecium circinans]